MRATKVALLAACAAAMLGGCGDGYETDDAAAVAGADRNGATPASPPAPRPAAPATWGSWTQGTEAGAKALVFAGTGGRQLFRIACDDCGGMLLERLGIEAVRAIGRVAVQSDSISSRLAVNPLETSPQVLRAAVPFHHELIAPLSAPEGLLTARVGDGAGLVLPLTAQTAALARSAPPGARPARSARDRPAARARRPDCWRATRRPKVRDETRRRKQP